MGLDRGSCGMGLRMHRMGLRMAGMGWDGTEDA